MKYFLLIMAISILFLAGCDDRGTENPKMEVWAETEHGGDFVYNKSNYEVMTFNFQLDGPLSKIIERKINVEIINDMGGFIGTGSSLYVITDDNGFASGRYYAQGGYGSAQIQFVLKDWPSEKETFDIPVLDFPKIDSLVAGTYTLLPDGIASTSITASVSSANIDFSDVDIMVIFEASDGTLTQSVTSVDISGVATTNLIAPDHQAYISVTAKLAMNPELTKSINIKCENP